MKALVVGAGIAGLVAARQLGLAGWTVDILEKSPGPGPDGYMMDFFGPGVEASEEMGLYPRLAALAYRVDAAEYVDAAGWTMTGSRGLGEPVDRLLELCPENPYDDVVAQVVMPCWHTPRVVLVGDAGAAVSLRAGQGGSLAIAGAAFLGEVLGPVASPDGIAPALAAFERRWRPVIDVGQASGRRAASTFLPANRAQRLLRRWVIRAAGLPGVDRLVARQILRTIAK